MKALVFVLILAGCSTGSTGYYSSSASAPSVQVHQRKDGSTAVYQFNGNGGWSTTVIPSRKK